VVVPEENPVAAGGGGYERVGRGAQIGAGIGVENEIVVGGPFEGVEDDARFPEPVAGAFGKREGVAVAGSKRGAGDGRGVERGNGSDAEAPGGGHQRALVEEVDRGARGVTNEVKGHRSAQEAEAVCRISEAMRPSERRTMRSAVG